MKGENNKKEEELLDIDEKGQLKRKKRMSLKNHQK